MNRYVVVGILIATIACTSSSARPIPGDTTETAGKGSRIAGFALLSVGIGMVALLAPAAYIEDRRSPPSDVGMFSMGYQGATWAVGGAVVIGVSIPFIVAGVRKRKEYLRWKEAGE